MVRGLDLADSADPRALRENMLRLSEWVREAIETINALEATPPGSGDNLGNHTATQNLAMGGFSITGVNLVDGVDLQAADPFTQYQRESEKGAANGYASLNASTVVPPAQLGTGSGGATKFLREDSSWQAVSGGSGHVIKEEGGAGLTQRTNLNFIGNRITATDNAGTDATDVTVTTPTGTGFAHITGGSEDNAAKLVETADITDANVTLAKLSDAPAASVLMGRRSGSAGDWEAIELGTGLAITGTTLAADDAVGARAYDAGAFTLANGEFAIFVDELRLSVSNEVVIEGDATLAVF